MTLRWGVMQPFSAVKRDIGCPILHRIPAGIATRDHLGVIKAIWSRRPSLKSLLRIPTQANRLAACMIAAIGLQISH